ncbi:hypothetical protein BJ138DRAFT_1167232 [Hygrophoropsis aurantiaca]|uniref:Uncharacterized protein n=1 Tax=Hygrophoropsis aurantiaca TaxID=72124 RepID=A0ACB7ZTJ5_9AGAM|nr:hypothetical protein BJ138DRAFT_1167232 [Hygrophoropsis aurantiaca]
MHGILSSSYLFLVASVAATLSHAATPEIYLSPPTTGASSSDGSALSAKSASLVLAQHLGLEQFEFLALGNDKMRESDRGNEYTRLGLIGERSFVGEGSTNALFLVVDGEHARDIIPPSLKPSFSIAGSEPRSSLGSLVSTYLQRARHVYSKLYSTVSLPSAPSSQGRVLDIFSAPSPANEAFLAEISVLSEFFESPSSEHSDKFAALTLTSLPQLASTYGYASAQYTLATRTIHALLEVGSADPATHIALLTLDTDPAPATNSKRSPQSQPPQQSPLPVYTHDSPTSNVSSLSSTCLGSVLACDDATDACSGRGECISISKAGKECFVCQCTREGWAGSKCEKKDVSGPFALLAGTTITLLLLIGGSISLLYSIGSQGLPSILTSSTGAVNGGRKD